MVGHNPYRLDKTKAGLNNWKKYVVSYDYEPTVQYSWHHALSFTFPKMVATYASVLCWGPVLPPSCENPFLVTLGLSRKPIKLCISSFYKALGTVLGTVAHRHLPNTQLCGTMALIANYVIFQIVINT